MSLTTKLRLVSLAFLLSVTYTLFGMETYEKFCISTDNSKIASYDIEKLAIFSNNTNDLLWKRDETFDVVSFSPDGKIIIGFNRGEMDEVPANLFAYEVETGILLWQKEKEFEDFSLADVSFSLDDHYLHIHAHSKEESDYNKSSSFFSLINAQNGFLVPVEG